MNTFRKLKFLLSILILIPLIFSLYRYYYMNTSSITLSLFITIIAALLAFIDGIEYIFIKKNPRIGYMICTLSILLPIPIIILIHIIKSSPK